jgi:cytochrome c oxidase accessory protein FixG
MDKHSKIAIHNIDLSPTANKQSIKVHNSKTAQKIYVRAVKGTIETFRRIFGFLFLCVSIALPWLTYNNQQAILFDFSAQRFHLFGITLWPQDLTLLAWLFIIAAFALFLITAVAGRVWCGFMCPQTVFTFMFIWIEEKTEGSRNKRIHLDKQPLGMMKILRKFSKHSLWLITALFTALTFVGYFYPISSLFTQFFFFELGFWPLFYVIFFTLCTYGNAGWMREIMCTHMCPYARFQSSMFDKDTLSVIYDKVRGESRGPRSKTLDVKQQKAKGFGDCIDCNLCVQVCPTGIDIRNGLQYECINCGACVDACNDVMHKMGYAKNLISFTSEAGLSGNQPKLMRPKVVGYLSVLTIMLSLLCLDIYTRSSIELDVVKDRHAMHRVTVDGLVENSFTLILMNKSQAKHKFEISISGLDGGKIIGSTTVLVNPSELLRHPVSVSLPLNKIHNEVHQFKFMAVGSEQQYAEQLSTFVYF